MCSPLRFAEVTNGTPAPNSTSHAFAFPARMFARPRRQGFIGEYSQELITTMDKLVIRGGNPLLGTVRISGAKNAALPCMAAALLTDEPVILENIPQVRDIETTRKLLAAMGAEVELGYGRAHHRTSDLRAHAGRSRSVL